MSGQQHKDARAPLRAARQSVDADGGGPGSGATLSALPPAHPLRRARAPLIAIHLRIDLKSDSRLVDGASYRKGTHLHPSFSQNNGLPRRSNAVEHPKGCSKFKLCLFPVLNTSVICP